LYIVFTTLVIDGLKSWFYWWDWWTERDS